MSDAELVMQILRKHRDDLARDLDWDFDEFNLATVWRSRLALVNAAIARRIPQRDALGYGWHLVQKS